jgi:CMD domain protein
MTHIMVTPDDDLIDVPRRIVVSGARAGALLELRTRTARGADAAWTSRAVFRADDHGVIDLSRHAPLEGDYSDVSPMGLIWSQAPIEAGKREVFPADVSEPLTTGIEVIGDDGRVLATALLTQRLMAPGVQRREMRDDGCVGTLFLPATPGPHPVVLVLNGSGGGINEPRGALYASRGYAALALGYFKTPGLSDYISNTPLEYFRRALDWITRELQPAHDFIAVSGQSRGGELALLLGATYPERINAVIGYVPGAVVHSAQNAADPATGREGPTWLLDGEPLPHLWENNRTASWQPFDDGPPPHRHERAIRTALLDNEAVERARIRVEQIDGPVLLLSATDDGSWPSSDYSRMVVDRLEREKHAYPVRHLDFDKAGHAIVFPCVPTTQLVYAHPVSGRISTGGGEPAANARADETSWREVLDFLDAAVRSRALNTGATMTDTYDLSTDIVDRVAGLTPGSATRATRHKRDKVAAATQRSYEALFDPALPDLSLTERLFVALYACTLSNASGLATHYAERLASIDADRTVIDQIARGSIDTQEPRLFAMLTFTRTLIEAPVDGDKAALERLPAAGISTPAVVALAQLIAFLSYQIRLTAGLRALQALNATEAA